MSEELEDRIARKKMMIYDFVKAAKNIGMRKEDYEKRLDAMLDDLSKLMKQR